MKTDPKTYILQLRYRGYDAKLVTPEDTDVPLEERVRRINAIALKYGISNTMAISIHVNATGMGKEWMSPTVIRISSSPSTS